MDTQPYTIDGMSDILHRFFYNHKLEDGSRPYLDQCDAVAVGLQSHVTLTWHDLLSTNLDKYTVSRPLDVVDGFRLACLTAIREKDEKRARALRHTLEIRIVWPHTIPVREIRAANIGQITAVAGIVVRASKIKLLGVECVYRCPDHHKTVVTKLQTTIEPPPICAHVDCKFKELTLSPTESIMVDFQMLRLQDTPEDLPAGHLPHHMDVMVRGGLVETTRPGDRVIVTGLCRPEHIPRAQQRAVPYVVGLDVYDVRPAGRVRDRVDYDTIPENERQILRQMGSESDILERLIGSFAPHVHGAHIIKESLLYQMVGSESYTLPDGHKIRGDTHIFLVGDPGTAKSEMLKFASRMAPRGLYTSGRGSTAAGLTAAVIKDADGSMTLEAGALVLADQGIACVDEFDKMRDEDRSALHECMEQQTASIAKGGIVATLHTRCSILAAANPQAGRWDPYKTIIDNTAIPIPLLTRFDLIWVMRDSPEQESDEAAAKHVLRRYRFPDRIRGSIEIDTLTKYVAVARRVSPKMTEEASDRLHLWYLERRSGDDAALVTLRQLEGAARITMARARLYMRTEATAEDAERAIDIIQASLVSSTGMPDSSGNVKPDVSRLAGADSTHSTYTSLILDLAKSLGNDPSDEEIMNEFKRARPDGDHAGALKLVRQLREDNRL